MTYGETIYGHHTAKHQLQWSKIKTLESSFTSREKKEHGSYFKVSVFQALSVTLIISDVEARKSKVPCTIYFTTTLIPINNKKKKKKKKRKRKWKVVSTGTGFRSWFKYHLSNMSSFIRCLGKHFEMISVPPKKFLNAYSYWDNSFYLCVSVFHTCKLSHNCFASHELRITGIKKNIYFFHFFSENKYACNKSFIYFACLYFHSYCRSSIQDLKLETACHWWW